jgi:hypothetical protein
MRRSVLRWWERCSTLPVLEQDALLYLIAGVFALGTVVLAESQDYRQWAELAVAPYFVAAVVCWLVARHRAQRVGQDGPPAKDRLRAAVVLGLLVTVMIVPLGVEVTLQAEAKPGDHVQNEVTVIEACGDRVAHHKDCYLTNPKNIGTSQTNTSEDSFFPYLPGMIPFGLINTISGPAELKDARVALSGFTLIVVGGALLIADIPSRRRWRIFQVLIILPSGALPMVTGGDDLPVLALLLLGLALATRRKPGWAGAAMGLAGTLKFTAWPLIVLLILGLGDRPDRKAVWRYVLAALVVAVPIMGVGIGSNLHAFVLNAIRFPLGLTRVKSPAASPLLGQELVSLFPSLKRELIACFALVGAGAVGYGLWRWPPKSPQAAAGFSGIAMLLATLLAPATRFGYLIYPLDLLTWAILFTPVVLRSKVRLQT